MTDPALTLGTAGHIDHGKTTLVRALTGVDTDRLPEERERGISIELGFARMDLPSGRWLSVVDVPGHERFVRTMVAGATGIDLFLLVVAADDGVMPQTREHLAVLEQLEVPGGVVALTKADVAGAEERALAQAEVEELLAAGPFAAAPVVSVSAARGTGLDELRARLETAARAAPDRARLGGPARLHVDRSFTLQGIGTVVTGTLWSGSIARGAEVRIEPGGARARVRGVEVHAESRAAGRGGTASRAQPRRNRAQRSPAWGRGGRRRCSTGGGIPARRGGVVCWPGRGRSSGVPASTCTTAPARPPRASRPSRASGWSRGRRDLRSCASSAR